MTINVSDNNPRINYSIAEGVTQTVFSVPFEFFEDSNVYIYVDGVLKSEGLDYTLTGGDGSTGTLTFVTATPPDVQQVTGAAGGTVVSIVRHVELERVTDFVAGQDINRAALNEQLDTIVAQIADLDDKVDRTIHLSDSEVAPSMLLTEDRKGRVLAFDATTGDVEAGPLSNDIQTIANNIAEILDADNQAAASAASATASASSASSSASSAAASASSATAAAASETAAAASETAAASSETNAASSASNAASSETAAASSETNAANSATASAASASAASSSASAASTSETNAAASETNAAASETAAAASETNAAASESAAATSATNAATSESNAATSASTATTKASEALASASAAFASETNAAASESAAASSKTASAASEAAALVSEAAAAVSEANASASASTASTAATTATTQASSATSSASSAATSEANAAASEANAASSEAAAATSASAASTSASNAATSETNAASSASSAASSASSAQASKDAALAALDSFDDRYLGQKASDPTLDNDGNALVAGALYFNTTDDVMKVYEGSVWVAAYASLSGALLQANNLSDVLDVAASRTNLGLGTAATTASTAYATAAQGALADSSVQPNDSPSFGSVTVTGTVDGRDVAADGTKLDGIEAGATADQTAGEIKAAYESNANTNAFTDAEQSKLSGIEAGATADQSASEILTAVKTVDGSGSGLDADLLDGQHGSYYYPASNPNGYTSSVGDITGVTAGTGLSGGGTSGTVTLSHADTSALSGVYGSTADGTKIDTITVDANGHVTAVTTGATGDIQGVTAGTGLSGGGTSGTVTLNGTTHSQATWEAGTSTTEAVVSPAKVKAAIDALAGGGFSYDAVSGATQALDVGSHNFFDAGTLTADTTVSFSNVPTEARWTYTALNQIAEFSVAGSTITNSNFDVSSKETVPRSSSFKPDGTKMFISGNSGSVHEYSLSTAWDVATASFTRSFSHAAQNGLALGMFFKPDGTAFYLATDARRAYQYSLSTAWDLSTASYASKSFLFEPQTGSARGIVLKTDGTKMYISEAENDRVYQYSLSTAWDLSTASYDSKFFDFTTQDTLSNGVALSPDGAKMFMVGQLSYMIYQYSLSTAWDVSTASYDNISSDISGSGTSPLGVTFSEDGDFFYIVDIGADTITRYTAGLGYVLSIPASVQNPPSFLSTAGQNTFVFFTADGGTTVKLIIQEVL